VRKSLAVIVEESLASLLLELLLVLDVPLVDDVPSLGVTVFLGVNAEATVVAADAPDVVFEPSHDKSIILSPYFIQR
jgi:hypothetical protein